MGFAKRRAAAMGLLVAGLAFASGKPAWGTDGEGLKNVKSGGHHKGAPGHKGLDGDLLDFDSVSPKDCANYLCVSSADKATYYIEAGCPGQFADYEPDRDSDEPMNSYLGFSSSAGASTGVSTGTLLSLACASGVFAVGVGFVAGYKASPSFAYMRIPSLS
ncbi:unnamed protein product [Ectocarpus sp. 12 AP-2014]